MIKRYEPIPKPEGLEDPQIVDMCEDEDGEWVEYEEYQYLEKKNKELQDEIKELRYLMFLEKMKNSAVY